MYQLAPWAKGETITLRPHQSALTLVIYAHLRGEKIQFSVYIGTSVIMNEISFSPVTILVTGFSTFSCEPFICAGWTACVL